MGNECFKSQQSASDKYAAKYSETSSGTRDEPPCKFSPNVHDGPVLAMSRRTINSNECLTGGEDGNIVLFNMKTNSATKKWAAHSSDITSISIACNRQMFVSASRDKLIKAWRLNDSNCLTTLRGHELNPGVVECSPVDPNIAVSGSRDNTVRLWDIETQSCISSVKHERNLVTDLCFADNHTFVQVSEDLKMRFWDCRTLDVAQFVPSNMPNIPTCVSVSSNGNEYVTGHKGFNIEAAQLIIWDRRMMGEVLRMNGHEHTVNKVSYMANGNIASISNDRTVRVWSSSGSGLLTKSLEEYGVESPVSLCTSESDDSRVKLLVGGIHDFVACFDHNLRLLSMSKS